MTPGPPWPRPTPAELQRPPAPQPIADLVVRCTSLDLCYLGFEAVFQTFEGELLAGRCTVTVDAEDGIDQGLLPGTKWRLTITKEREE